MATIEMSTNQIDSEVEQLFRDAQLLADRSELDKALLLYSSILKRDPQSVRALVQRGIMLVMLDRDDEAMADFEAALALDPAYGLAYFGRGWVRGGHGDPQGELEDAQRGLELDPDNAHLYYRRMGAANNRMKRFAEAQAFYTKAIELGRDTPSAYFNRGISFEAAGNDEKALTDFTRAIEILPGWTWALAARGRVYGKLGQTALAFADFALAIQFNSKYAETYKERGSLYETLGEMDLARADYEVAASLEKSPVVLKDLQDRLKQLESSNLKS